LKTVPASWAHGERETEAGICIGAFVKRSLKGKSKGESSARTEGGWKRWPGIGQSFIFLSPKPPGKEERKK